MQFQGQHFIDGRWVPVVKGASTFEKTSPMTGEVLGVFPSAIPEQVNLAVGAARRAFPGWKARSRIERAELFDKLAARITANHDRLVETISVETGKNLNESHAEVMEALHMCQCTASMGRKATGETFGSELATKDVQVIRKPKGVVAIISPWNFPLAIGSFWCAGPSLVEGNTVVHKPSELTPMTNQIAAELYEEAGFPPGVFNLVHGAEVTGKALVRADVNVILFTGSAEVGREIRQHCAETWHKSCSCEMGSKSAVMVFADGDMDLAVDSSIASAFKLSGQRCVSASRILVERKVFDQFKERFVAKAKEIKVGNPFNDPKPFYGPLINETQVRRVMTFNDMVKNDKDAKVLIDYQLLPAEDCANCLTPFVYEVEWANKPYLKQEVFGPHVALIPFDSLEDAIRIYNDTDYGLSLAAITDDFRKHRIIRDNCDTGMLYINGTSIGAESHLPFGGVKKSGNGWKSAVGTVAAVTDEVAITTNYEQGRVQFAQGMK